MDYIALDGGDDIVMQGVAEAQRQGGIAAFVDAEHAVDPIYARHLGVVNGTRGVVTRVDADALALCVRTRDGRDLTLPKTYLESTTQLGGRTLDHGYAITGHHELMIPLLAAALIERDS